MGSRRRLEAKLEAQGVSEDKIQSLADAIEVLQNAGDSYADAIFEFTEHGDKVKCDKELQTTAYAVLKARYVMTSYLDPEGLNY